MLMFFRYVLSRERSITLVVILKDSTLEDRLPILIAGIYAKTACPGMQGPGKI